MSYEIPNTFVPGTKAKADEVNANFVSIAEEINDINGDIDSINSAVLTKAASSDIDGSWTLKNTTLVSNVTISAGGGTKNYSLSTYLPDDNNIYEVLFCYTCYITSSSYAMVTITSSLAAGVPIANLGSGDKCAASSIIIPIGTNRQLSLISTSSQTGTLTSSIYLKAYRKVR